VQEPTAFVPPDQGYCVCQIQHRHQPLLHRGDDKQRCFATGTCPQCAMHRRRRGLRPRDPVPDNVFLAETAGLVHLDASASAKPSALGNSDMDLVLGHGAESHRDQGTDAIKYGGGPDLDQCVPPGGRLVRVSDLHRLVAAPSPPAGPDLGAHLAAGAAKCIQLPATEHVALHCRGLLHPTTSARALEFCAGHR